jgi:hypothetical protein
MQTNMIVPLILSVALDASGLALIFRPEVVVRAYARFYRSLVEFHRHYQYGERYLDRLQSPLSRWVLGSITDFAEQAPDSPGRFSRALMMVRLLGTLALLVGTVLLALILVA